MNKYTLIFVLITVPVLLGVVYYYYSIDKISPKTEQSIDTAPTVVVEKDTELQGYIYIGEGVNSFNPCGAEKEYWISGGSPALKEIKAEHAKLAMGASPYTPIFGTIFGKIMPAPTDGFGTDYDNAIVVNSFSNLTKDGNCKIEFIILDNFMPGEVIRSPLKLSGKARTWYFEGSFPIELRDDTGKVIKQSFVTAQGDWMTTEFVPFKGTLEFKRPDSSRGTLIFKKDNPSDDRSLDNSLEIPIIFQ